MNLDQLVEKLQEDIDRYRALKTGGIKEWANETLKQERKRKIKKDLKFIKEVAYGRNQTPYKN